MVAHRRSWWTRHRTPIVATVAAVVVVGGVTTALLATRNLDDVAVSDPSLEASFAVPSTAPPTTSAPTTAPATASTSASAPPRTSAKGKVVTVVSADRWTISVEHGLDLTVVASGATKFLHDRTASDVHKGSTLAVIGTMSGGVITATSVSIEKGSST